MDYIFSSLSFDAPAEFCVLLDELVVGAEMEAVNEQGQILDFPTMVRAIKTLQESGHTAYSPNGEANRGGGCPLCPDE